ncbi:histidinol-phosphatase [Oceanomicrobium pacificus]|uniref:Histidinol-phosphatase n=1 Tax=Oceanomicrobium pacificus TaxID=2692916 RepID=A0A6B0THD9_9RHOB|nr:histidinol-phosphatase [Oceanomicrobium pacificus]MXU63827.1 histidinol-phosphatase [Oceanomicrobium pacificus]
MRFSKELQDSLRNFAGDLAEAARPETLRHFRSANLRIDNKQADAAGFDPVTQADRAAEAAMRALIDRHRPDDGVLGEEFPAKPSASGLTWVLDPIDGTRAYLSGTPSWGVLIGLDAGDGPVLGVIDQPFTGERFLGGFGQAVHLHRGFETPIRTRRGVDLSDAVLFTTFPEVGTEAERQGFAAVRDRVRLTRYGLDCYAYALLAMGQVDLVIEAGLNPYDIQGPIGVIEGAGGIVTDWTGGPAHQGGQVVAAGDPDLHRQALDLLAPFADSAK